jgi:hypothetical protein
MVIAALLFAWLGQPTSLETRLRKELGGIAGVKFSQDGDTLVVTYRTKWVNVRKESKSRQPTYQTIPNEVPSVSGFKLKTYEFSHNASDPPIIMQAARIHPDCIEDHGAWKVDADNLQVDGTNKARYYFFEWGLKADSAVVKRIRGALEFDAHPMRSSRKPSPD